MKNKNPYGNLFIGSGVIAKGTLNIPGEAIINGTFEGELNAASINVMPAGVVTGKSVADTITVSGKINQSTTAKESLVIDSTGTLAGQVSYGEIEIRKGGVLQGAILMLPKNR